MWVYVCVYVGSIFFFINLCLVKKKKKKKRHEAVYEFLKVFFVFGNKEYNSRLTVEIIPHLLAKKNQVSNS